MRVTVGQRKGEKLGNDGGMITRNDADPGKGREKHYPLVLLNKDLVYEESETGRWLCMDKGGNKNETSNPPSFIIVV